MKTAEEVISDFRKLDQDQQEKVIQFVMSAQEEKTNFLNQAFEAEYVEEENYSPEDIALLDRLQEEAEQGINIEEFSSMDEAIKSLGLS